MNKFLTRHTPPGIEWQQEMSAFLLGQTLSLLFSLGFFANYLEARSNLFEYAAGKRYLIEGAQIADFHGMTRIWFLGFGMMVFYLLGLILHHYLYYRRGTMSIYLMKRLPNRRERHRRALMVPCLSILATAATALTLRFLYFAVYLLATPKVCLPDEVWQQLWRIF